MDRKQAILFGVGGIALLAGVLGLSYYAAKRLQAVDGDEPTSKTEPNSSGTSSSSGSQSNSASSSSSTSSGNTNISYVPALSGNKHQIDWSVRESETSYPEDSFIVTISNIPANATEKDKELNITSDDDALDEWIQIYQVKTGSETTLSSPYTFHSGETVRLRQKKKAPVIGGYKISLRVISPNFDAETTQWFIDINMTTND
jgi:hypothetical protein